MAPTECGDPLTQKPAQNYFVYPPPDIDQIGALREAHDLKSKNMIRKALDTVFLDKETLDEIEHSNLTLIATIPLRGIHIHPRPSTRIPKKKGTTPQRRAQITQKF